jgi:ABC-2 type transport system permease protein
MKGQQTLETIWSKRASDFRKETLPYIRYMGQSGFPAFLSLLFISAAIGYFTLLRNVPEHFPFAAVGVAVLTPAVCWNPLRTWLTAADTVFMMPREAQMGRYLQRSFRHTSVGGVLLVAAVLLLYLPLFRQSAASMSGIWIILIAAVLKAVNVWAAWRERQLTWPGMRRLLRIVRWMLAGAVLTVWLTALLWQAALFTLLAGLLLGMTYRLPSRHSFPWERLIAEEERTRKRYYVFFGLFIDVPTLPSATARRSYLAWLLRLIPYSRRRTFFYLYTASLLRTETGGIVLRLLALGCLVSYWLADAAVLNGWGAAVVLLLFTGVLALQLGGLRHVHRYSVWHHVYPLPDKQRLEQYIKVDRFALSVCVVLLLLFTAVPLTLAGLYLPVMATAALLLLYLIIRPTRLAKQIRREIEEE